MSSAQMILLKSLSFLESSLLSQAWEKFPLPPSAAAAQVKPLPDGFQRRSHLQQQFRGISVAGREPPRGPLTLSPKPDWLTLTNHPQPYQGPLAYTHPDQMVFLGRASWSEHLSNHTYCQLSVKDPWIRESLSHLHYDFCIWWYEYLPGSRIYEHDMIRTSTGHV